MKEYVNELPSKFLEVIKHEGVVSITSWGVTEIPHVVNTWNSYIVLTADNRLLIPAYGFRKTQKNVDLTQQVILTIGSKDVVGYKDYQGTGFYIVGDAQFITAGEEYDTVKQQFSFANRVLEVKVTLIQQKI